MPPEVVERAFEPFFTTKEVGKGTGLGLSQIHGFAAQAGGRAEIRSKAGDGTTITLVLPATDKEIAQRRSRAMPCRRCRKGFGCFWSRTISRSGNSPRACSPTSGARLSRPKARRRRLSASQSNGIDLVVTDVVMPGMSGVELADADPGDTTRTCRCCSRPATATRSSSAVPISRCSPSRSAPPTSARRWRRCLTRAKLRRSPSAASRG